MSTRGRYRKGKPFIEGENSLTITSDDDLQTKYDWLKSSGRDGNMGALSATNWRWLILTPGTYTDALTMDTDYVGVVALHKHRDSAVLSTTPTITATTYSLLGITCTDTGRYYSGNLCVEVAASDAPLYLKSNADYVCDGTADEVQINAAIIAAAATTPGGKVQLSSGYFNVAAPIDFYRADATSGNNVALVGAGTSSTSIRPTAGADCNVMQCIISGAQSIGWITLAEFTIDGNFNNMASGSGIYIDKSTGGGSIYDIHIDHVMCIHCKEYGMYFSYPWGLKLNNSITEVCYGTGLYINHGAQCYVSNHFSAYNDGIGIDMVSCDGLQLMQSYVYDNGLFGLKLNGSHCTVNGIIVLSYGRELANQYGIYLDSIINCKITNFSIFGQNGSGNGGADEVSGYGMVVKMTNASGHDNKITNGYITGHAVNPMWFRGPGSGDLKGTVVRDVAYALGSTASADIVDDTTGKDVTLEGMRMIDGTVSIYGLSSEVIPLNKAMQVAAMKTTLPDTPDETTLGLAAAAGSTIVGTTTNGGATASATETLAFYYRVPPNYRTQLDLTIRIRAQVHVARNAESLLDVVVKRVVDAGLDATDICTTTPMDIKAVVAFADHDFTIDGNATGDELEPGTLLYIEVSLETDDTGATVDGYGEISNIKVLAPKE